MITELLEFSFPTETLVCGGGIVSCQDGLGILCVNTEYSEDLVRRQASTLRPL